ncbi:MAG: ChaN family lipoprotein [Acidobacteriota bacterium]|nr:ChaN family lipoprotein [Acidobacteriota bacterium]
MLIGEYHPLPGALETAGELLVTWAERSRGPRLLALEMVYRRDQAALDALMAGRIGEREFHRRIRYREEWGYPWRPVRRLLQVARRTGGRVAALDISPRGGAQDLPLRDEVAAERLVRLSAEAGRGGRVAAVFGEAHLASEHLPRRLERMGGAGRVARVLTDLEFESRPAAPWMRARGRLWATRPRKPGERLAALSRVYRHWARQTVARGEMDLPLMVHGVITALARAVDIDPRRLEIGPALYLADLYPEVYLLREEARLGRRLRETGQGTALLRRVLSGCRRRGAVYQARENLLVASGRGVQGLGRAAGAFLVAALRARAMGAEHPLPPGSAALERLDAVLAAHLAAPVEPRSVAGARPGPRTLRRWLLRPALTDRAARRRLAALGVGGANE